MKQESPCFSCGECQFPEIHTTATDSETADHLTLADSRAVITDTVTYTNLLKGETYTLSGVLMDKETGKELLVDGEPVTQEMAFTAGRASGTKKLKFEFDTTGLAGKSFVVYAIASHNDINDAAQTITMIAPQKPKTGDYMSVVMYVLAGIAGVMAIICSFFRKKAVSKKKH